MHATILAFMFSLVEEDKIGAHLCDNPHMANALYVQEYVAQLLKQAFPHIQQWVGFWVFILHPLH